VVRQSANNVGRQSAKSNHNRRLPVDDMRRMQLPNGAGDLGAIAENREGA